MRINVHNQVKGKDGDKVVTLRAAKNPHDVGNELGKQLVADGLATKAAGRPNGGAQAGKAAAAEAKAAAAEAKAAEQSGEQTEG